MLTPEMERYAEESYGELLQLIRDIAPIPAPSRHEDKRVEWIVDYLKAHGAEGVFVDEAKNVIWPYNVTDDNDIFVLMAHTDVVFPDTTPLPFREDEKYFYCPGVGDDTARLAVLLMAARFFIERKKKAKYGFLFIANSCEEGLGNSFGAKTVCKNYGKRIKRFVSNDSALTRITNRAVGSDRYEVTVRTEGGHSFSKFGNKNAIHEACEILHDLYQVQVPVKENTKTTFNVGTISGGTSVNTIAQEARFLYEYRSDDRECLDHMRRRFEEIIAAHQSDKVEVSVDTVGRRPCGSGGDPEVQKAFEKLAADAILEITGNEASFGSGSTDANYPLSYGIPAFTMGTSISFGTHTREEYLEIASLKPGMRVMLSFLGNFFED